MIGAISTDGIEAAIYGEWSADVEIFLAFVKERSSQALYFLLYFIYYFKR